MFYLRCPGPVCYQSQIYVISHIYKANIKKLMFLITVILVLNVRQNVSNYSAVCLQSLISTHTSAAVMFCTRMYAEYCYFSLF